MLGTGRTRDRAATEARILAAARQLFASEGYDRVTVRAIATAATANPALINRYFGSKQQLFGAVIAEAFRSQQLLEGRPDDLPRRLAEFCLGDRSAGDRALVEALNRSAAVPELRAAVADRVDGQFVQPLADLLGGGPQARVRALAATALLTGVGTQRRSLGTRGLPSGEQDVAVEVLADMFAAALGRR
ncbi:MAG: TetR family transcriptional regulator [Streptosporangiales bacterium]|nr:TetR family transcriptional regulator [Streptosporangiales bacterium]